MSAPWYTRVFGPDYFILYQRMDEVARQQADLVAECLGLPAGARILDLCGGYGRIAIPLAEKGYRVTVLDLSEHFLQVGRERAGSLPIQWLRADMREVPQTGDFDAVINIFSAFGYLESDEEDERVLHAARGALRPGGLFLLEVVRREALLRSNLPLRNFEEFAEGVLVEEVHFDEVAGRANSRRTFYDLRTAEKKDFSHSIRLYTAAEYRRMLTRAGLTAITFHGSLGRAPLTPESRRLVVMARKSTDAA